MEVLIVQDLKFLICLLQTLVNICNQLICVTYVWVQSCEILLPPSPYHMIDCDHVGLLRTPYHTLPSLHMWHISGSYQITESMQTISGLSGESVLSSQGHYPSSVNRGTSDFTSRDDHKLETPPHSNLFYEHSQCEFYPQVPEQKYRPPTLLRMNSGKSYSGLNC